MDIEDTSGEACGGCTLPTISARQARLLKHQVREERQKAESIALYQTQIRGTDALLLHMPKLGEYLDEWSLDGPGTIQWSDKNTAILGEGGFGKVMAATIRYPGGKRVAIRNVALKLSTRNTWEGVAGDIDHEVTHLFSIHDRVTRACATMSNVVARLEAARKLESGAAACDPAERVEPRTLRAVAVPLKPPVPEVLGLHSEEVPNYFAMEPRVAGFFMERHHASLLDVIAQARGPVAGDEFFRVVQALGTALGLVHHGGACGGPARQGGCAGVMGGCGGEHLGGLHCDVKAHNILVRLDKGGRLDLPVHTARRAASTGATNPAIVLSDFGLALPAADRPHNHRNEIVTITYRSQALAISDLARMGEALGDVLPRGTPRAPVQADLKLDSTVDTHALGVVCWDMLRAAPIVGGVVPFLQRAARGVAQASGDAAQLPTRAERAEFAFAMLLTGGMHVPAQELLRLVQDTFGERLILRAAVTAAQEGGEEVPEHGRERQIMPMGYLLTMARASHKQVARGSARDEVVAEAAYRLPGELLVHKRIGILETGREVPAPDVPADLRLPEGWGELLHWRCGVGPATLRLRRRERPRDARARHSKRRAAAAAGRAVIAGMVVPLLCAVAAVVAGSRAAAPELWCDNEAAPEWSDEDSGTESEWTAGSFYATDCSLHSSLSPSDKSPQSACVTGVLQQASPCGDGAPSSPDLAVLLDEASWLPAELAAEINTGISGRDCEGQHEAEVHAWTSLGAVGGALHCSGEPGEHACAAQAATDDDDDAWTPFGRSTAVGAEALRFGLSPAAKVLLAPGAGAAPQGGPSACSDAENEAPGLEKGGPCESRSPAEGQAVESQEASEAEEEMVSGEVDTGTEVPQERVTFGGYISLEDPPPLAGGSDTEAGECTPRDRASGEVADSGRLIGSCPGEAPSSDAGSAEAAARPSCSVGCLSEAKMSLAGAGAPTCKEDEGLLEMVPAGAAPGGGSLGLLWRLKRALCFGGAVHAAHAGRQGARAEVDARRAEAAATTGARPRRTARVLRRLVGCRGMRVKD